MKPRAYKKNTRVIFAISILPAVFVITDQYRGQLSSKKNKCKAWREVNLRWFIAVRSCSPDMGENGKTISLNCL